MSVAKHLKRSKFAVENSRKVLKSGQRFKPPVKRG